MAAVQGQFTLPLLAFQHHVGKLYIDPAEIQFAKGLGQSDLCIVEQGRWKGPNGRYTNIVCKVWRPFVVATPQDFRELLLEAAKLHRLKHPNITRFLGLGCFAHGSLAEVRESMFMVEEYVGERTLRKLISEQMRCRHKNLYDMRAALRWACQIASALAALHDQQPAYVHNDVKADNVFLTDVSQNMFLSDTARVGASDAKLGDLKPHRHVYDREPSTLSRHQQQQRQHSPKAPHPGTLQPPRYSLERNSGCSSTGSGERRLSWSSTASSTVAGAIQSGGQQQQQQGKVQFVSASLTCKTSSIGAKSSKQQQQQQRPKTPAFLHASNAFALDGDSSWSSACSTVTPTADAVAAVTPAVASASTDTDAKPPASPAAAAAAQSEGVTSARSLPMPIAARGSHAFRGSSCPTNWNPGLEGQSTVTDCVGSPSAAAQGSPTYASANSQCSYSSFNSASVCNSSSTVAGLSTCASSAPPATCSLAAEIAAADAAAAAAEAASAAAQGSESSRSGWRALTRQRSSSANGRLSDSASSTGGGGKGGASKGGSGSLAADLDAEDTSDRSAEAAADISGAEVPAARHSIEDLDSPRQQQQQQRGRRGLAKGALATAFAHVKQDSHHQPQQQQQHEAVTGPDLASSPPDVGQAAPSSPQKRLLGMFYKRSKSSPLEDDGVHHPHMQLARSAPDVTHRDIDDEAVHHGALLMPLQLSEPTGLCSLQSADASPDRPHTSSAAAAVEAQHAKQAAAHRQQLQHAKSQPISSSHSSMGAAGGDSCVYYGWELLPSGAASPCGAVHSSMLDLFADVNGEDVVTSRRYRDSCHYTLVPGSFVQQRSPLSISSAGPAAITRSKSTPASWDAGAVAASGISSSNSSSSQVAFAASAGSKWTPATLLQLQQQQQQQGSEQLERAPSIGKGCAPTAIESKQHGGNSAFAALTAIDCIAEEGSSIATDSCAPSCSASRESSARDGSYFYRTPTLSTRGSAEAPQTPQQQASLVTAGSLTKALGLSLLRSRSGGARSSGSGGLTEDDRQDSSRTRSPPASPRDCTAHSVSSSSPQSPGAYDASPSKKHLLQLLVTASGGSLGSGDIAAAPQHETPLDQNAAYCLLKQVQFDQQQQQQQQADAGSAVAQGTDTTPASAAAPTKKVRFSLARPSGLTASRDFGLVYAAPELVRGERPTEKVDVFAFGVLLYELLSRKLVASSVAEVCARNSSRRGSRHSKHSKSVHKQQLLHQQLPQADADLNSGSNSDCSTLIDEVPEHQLLLQYAQLVAGGYRPPMLPHFPAPVVQLISSCWAAEPHERPRMSEVLLELQSWGKNRPLMSALNAYVLALADMGYTGRAAAQPGCGCVIS